MKAVRLKTADLSEALGIDVKEPRLSWNCSDGIKQNAYRVTAFDEVGNCVFDSGRTDSDRMYCTYAGKELKSRMRITWKVCLWDEAGKAEWSEEAVFEMGLLKEKDWEAKWIAGVGTDQQARLPADYYKREFILGCDIKKARLYITALGVYTAKINDVCVSSVLAPGTTQYDKTLHYQTYDVTGELLEGERNCMKLCVADGWYKGKLGADQTEYLFGTQTKVLAQLEITYASGKREIIATDDKFLWCNDGPVRFSDLMDGEVYDANQTPSYGQRAQVCTEERRILRAADAPAVKEQEVFRPALEISPSGKQILNFGQNIAGYVRFRVNMPKDKKLRIRMFEVKDHGEYSDASLGFPETDTEPVKQEILYVSSGEKERFQPEFFYAGFQYALVEGIGQINPEDFEAVAVYSDLEFGGMFLCSNEKINQYVNNTVWSMKSNFVYIPTDCPQREKSGWSGDAQIFCRTAGYFADTRAFYRKWLRDVRDCQRENGLVENVNPKVNRPDNPANNMSGSVGWADAAVIIPYTLWKQTGDVSFIHDNMELMLGWMHYMEGLCKDKSMFAGLPEGHPFSMIQSVYRMYQLKDSPWNCYIPEAGIHWGEWCVPASQEKPEGDLAMEMIKPKQELTCAYTHSSMRMLMEMLEAVGKREYTGKCREYAQGSRNAYHFHWVKDGRISTRHMAELVRPLALGLLEPEEAVNVAKELNDMAASRNYKVGTGFLSTPFILQVLAENGYPETAYRILENTEAPGWLAQVAQGATSVWEEYEGYDADDTPRHCSFNHYSLGAVCSFLFDTVCGICIEGENLFRIAPVPGGTLNYACAETMTAYGKVKSSWRREGKTVKYILEIPPNTSGELILPDGSRRKLQAGEHCFVEKFQAVK